MRTSRSRRRLRIGAARPARSSAVIGATAVCAASPAHAHLVETGFGTFYDGLAHVVLTPVDLLLVVALALFAGQRGAQAARWTTFALPLAWLAGGLLGARMPGGGAAPLLTTLGFGLTGILIAFDAKVRAPAVVAIAIVAGLAHGYVSGATMAPGGASALGLLGAATAVFCLVALLSAQVTTLQAGWTRIAVRVAGSWLAASGLLMLGWLAR